MRVSSAGLRIGNMKTMPSMAKAAMDPIHREHLLNNVPLQRCAANIMSTFDAQSFAKSVADDLFPAAQAVGTESLPVSACLRFSVEYSRLRVLRILQRTLVERSSEMEVKANLQQATVSRWKHLCESQLGLLAVCKSNGIFEMVPESEHEHNCSFKILDTYDGASYYVGPASCLVYIKSTQAFYDPCLHPSKPCNARGSTYILSDLLNTPATRLQFDVRSLGNGEVLLFFLSRLSVIFVSVLHLRPLPTIANTTSGGQDIYPNLTYVGVEWMSGRVGYLDFRNQVAQTFPSQPRCA